VGITIASTWRAAHRNGNGSQNWTVSEYRVVNEGGQWRVDAIAPLGMVFPTSDASGKAVSGEWGPYSRHGSIDSMETDGPSQLYPGQKVPVGPLQSLEAKALADDK
jgi:hypothetical protein